MKLTEKILNNIIFPSLYLAQVDQKDKHLPNVLHMRLQTLVLQEAAKMSISFAESQQIQVLEAFIDSHLQVEGTFHGCRAINPFIDVWLFNVTEGHAASSLILKRQEHLGKCRPLMRLIQEEAGEVLVVQTSAVTEGSHGQVDVGDIELELDMTVDGGLAFRVVVLTHLRR